MTQTLPPVRRRQKWWGRGRTPWAVTATGWPCSSSTARHGGRVRVTARGGRPVRGQGCASGAGPAMARKADRLAGGGAPDVRIPLSSRRPEVSNRERPDPVALSTTMTDRQPGRRASGRVYGGHTRPCRASTLGRPGDPAGGTDLMPPGHRGPARSRPRWPGPGRPRCADGNGSERYEKNPLPADADLTDWFAIGRDTLIDTIKAAPRDRAVLDLWRKDARIRWS